MPIFAKRRHAAKRFLPGFAPRGRKYSEDQERDEGGPKRTEVHVFSDAKLLYWKKVDRIARQYESDALAATRTALEIDKRELLVLLGEAHKSALRNKQSIDWRKYSEATRDYLRTQAGANWREQFLPVLEGVMTDGVNTMRDEFGFRFDVPNIGAQEWFTEYALEFASPINGTTAGLVEEVIAMGVDEGWSIDAMADHLEEVFRQMAYGDVDPEDLAWFEDRMVPYRAEAIARTETMRAENFGNEELMRDWGVEQKEWLATPDERVREAHWDANGQVVGIDEPFIVDDEELDYPGDPAGSPGNTINCRCTILPVLPGEASE